MDLDKLKRDAEKLKKESNDLINSKIESFTKGKAVIKTEFTQFPFELIITFEDNDVLRIEKEDYEFVVLYLNGEKVFKC